MKAKQVLTYVISLGIGVVLFYGAFSFIDDKEALWETMRSARWEGIAASFVMGYLAIVSRGFFQVEAPNGDILYTENGQFQLNAEGMMVNAQGLPLTPAIEVPEGSTGFTVGADGIVTAILPGDTLPSELGQITLVNFTNPGGLEALGGNLYRESVASGEPVEGVAGEEGLGQLKQGVLEGSNVQVVEAMVNMISIQRAYEANAKVLDAASGMQQCLNQTV